MNWWLETRVPGGHSALRTFEITSAVNRMTKSEVSLEKNKDNLIDKVRKRKPGPIFKSPGF